MYEILHNYAPKDELDFYLSYAEKNKKILEPLCGSGRFLIPFLEQGFDIFGMDLSSEMLAKLREKSPKARVEERDILKYSSQEKFDYIFISSGSISLFTDINSCKEILKKVKELLNPDGKFVFAVDTINERCLDDTEYKVAISVKTKDGLDIVLKNKNYYDEKTQTQFSPSIYELYNKAELLQSEFMDFQTHLYNFGEMEEYLKEVGFNSVIVYSSFQKEKIIDEKSGMLLYECSI